MIAGFNLMQWQGNVVLLEICWEWPAIAAFLLCLCCAVLCQELLIKSVYSHTVTVLQIFLTAFLVQLCVFVWNWNFGKNANGAKIVSLHNFSPIPMNFQFFQFWCCLLHVTACPMSAARPGYKNQTTNLSKNQIQESTINFYKLSYRISLYHIMKEYVWCLCWCLETPYVCLTAYGTPCIWPEMSNFVWCDPSWQ